MNISATEIPDFRQIRIMISKSDRGFRYLTGFPGEIPETRDFTSTDEWHCAPVCMMALALHTHLLPRGIAIVRRLVRRCVCRGGPGGWLAAVLPPLACPCEADHPVWRNTRPGVQSLCEDVSGVGSTTTDTSRGTRRGETCDVCSATPKVSSVAAPHHWPGR